MGLKYPRNFRWPDQVLEEKIRRIEAGEDETWFDRFTDWLILVLPPVTLLAVCLGLIALSVLAVIFTLSYIF
jgi:hypothetical protein